MRHDGAVPRLLQYVSQAEQPLPRLDLPLQPVMRLQLRRHLGLALVGVKGAAVVLSYQIGQHFSPGARLLRFADAQND